MTNNLAEQSNQCMVDRMIAEGALWSPRLIAAFRATPRHRFLDRIYQFSRREDRWCEIPVHDLTPQELALVYSDRALITRISSSLRNLPPGAAVVPISSSSQPSLMAQMLEDLRLAPGQRILEVGAGTGYNAALLAHVVGPECVYTVDVDRAVLTEAWEHLEAFPERRVHLRHADGRAGYAEAAPYDRIIVTAATDDLEPAWSEQLAETGLLLAPLVLAPGLAFLVRGTLQSGTFHGRLTRGAYFMPLRAEDEAGRSEAESLGLPLVTQHQPAPWAGWFERRRSRLVWIGFVQSLVFFGWLRGLSVHYRELSEGRNLYGISSPTVDAVCWFDAHEWQVSGDGGRELAEGLWRAFLEAGGPWPTEFRLRVRPGGGLRTDHPQGFMREGPRYQQVWELIESRDRLGWM